MDTVLFDLDGTLVDACDWHFKAFNQSLKRFGIKEITIDEHLHLFNGLPTSKKMELLQSTRSINDKDITNIIKEKQINTIKMIQDFCHPSIETLSVLEYLKWNGYKIGCVTNSIKETCLLMLERSKTLSYMGVVITNEDVKWPKPDPEGYRLAANLLKSNPLDCVVVEDGFHGIAAAKKFGAGHIIKVASNKDITLDLFRNVLEK